MRREIVNTMYDNMGVNTHTWLATVVGQGLVIINPIPKVLHLPTKRELSPVEARFVKCVGTSLLASSPLLVSPGGGGGGYFRNFLVGMCRWDPRTNLYQS